MVLLYTKITDENMTNIKVIQFREHLASIKSTKVTIRRRGAESLKRFLEDNEIDLDNLEDHQDIDCTLEALTWPYIIQSLFYFLTEESEALHKEEKERKSTFEQHKSSARRTFHAVFRLINKNENSVPANTLLTNIFTSFERSLLKHYFGDVLLKILENSILSKPKVVGDISEKHWCNILQIIKSFKETDVSLIYMVFKWGPLHKMGAIVFREEFPFIEEICRDISLEMTRSNQENIIKLVLQFTEFTCPDSRLTNCKMTESIFVPLINIYDKSRDGNMQKDLNQLFYLQIILHHSRGSAPPLITDSSPSAQSLTCAYSWTEWTRCLQTLHIRVCERFESQCRKQRLHHHRSNAQFYGTQCTNSSSSNSNSYGSSGSDKQEACGKVGNGLLDPSLLKLLVEVNRQIFADANESVDITQHREIDELDCTVSSNKRARIDKSLTGMVDRIGLSQISTDDWSWIALLDHFLRKYPTAISRRDYESLVVKLSKMQLLENLMTDYINDCLMTLVNIEKSVYCEKNLTEIESQVQEAWKRIWESTLRLVGLKKYPESTHRLLDRLIKYRKCCSQTDLLKLYFDNVIFVSAASIRTLSVLCENYPIQDTIFANEDCLRRKIINWVLVGGVSSGVFVHASVANFLVKITFKQWPIEKRIFKRHKNVQSTFAYFEEVENIYELNSFTKLLEICDQSDQENISETDNHCLVINEILHELYHELLKISSINDSTNNDNGVLTNLTILLLNVLSNLIKYNAMDETALEDNILTQQIRQLLQKLSFNLEVAARRIQYSTLRLLKPLFKLELVESVQIFLKKHIPLQLLTTIHQLTKDDNTKDASDLQMIALELFALYAFWDVLEIVNQKFAADTILKFCFVIKSERHYEMVKLALNHVITCKVGQFSHEYLFKITSILQIVSDAKDNEYEAACFTLQFLHEIFPHIAVSNSEELQKECTKIFYSLFSKCKNYGPKVSMWLIKCLKQIWQLDPLSSWTFWENVREESKIVLNLPAFLKNDYVTVRYVAIDCLITIFKSNEHFTFDIFNVQKELLDGIVRQSSEVFFIEGDLSAEQIFDETATRTATVMHTFASIILYSSSWRKRVLAEFFKLAHQRKLFSSSMKKLLTLVALKLNCQSRSEFLKKYESYLVLQWDAMKLSLTDFPYKMFDYDDLSCLLANNINVIYPLLMQRHYGELLQIVCGRMCKSIDGLSQVSYPYLRSYFLMVDCTQKDSDAECLSLADKQRFDLIKASLSNLDPSELDSVHIEPTILNLLDSIFDLDHVNATYNLALTLPKPEQKFINVRVFKATLKVLEESLEQSSLILYLFTSSPKKIQSVLLSLKYNVYKADNIVEKIIKFHAYAIFSTLVASNLHQPQAKNMCEFLVRDFIYTHLNFLDLHKNSVFQTLCIRNFGILLDQLLPYSSLQIHEHVSVIINKCVQIIGNNNEHLCLELLDILVLKNAEHLCEALLIMDPFPNKDHFRKYSDHDRDNNLLTAEEAITRFLESGNGIWQYNECRVEGIKSLRKFLASYKEQLLKMYGSLMDTRGFSEDCNNSLIHRLLCSLIKYSTSNDVNTSLEATRCLGELGARDLTTIILTPQSFHSNIGSSYKYFIHSVISVLIQYQIDENIDVVIKTNQALLHITENGNNLDDDSYYIGGRICKSYLAPFAKEKCCKRAEPTLDKASYFNNLTKDLWCPTGVVIKHDTWLKNLVIALFKCFNNDACLNYLIDLVRLKISFAEKILPVTINFVIACSSPEVLTDIETNINRFFQRHANMNKAAKDGPYLEEIAMQKESLRCMLGVVHFIRFERMNKRKKFANFNFNYLEIALAGQFCSAYFTAILYGELWCYNFKTQLKESQDLKSRTYDQNETMFKEVYRAASDDQKEMMEKVFLESYSALGETDAVACCHLTFFCYISTKTNILKIRADILAKENDVSEANSLWYSMEEAMDIDTIYKMGVWDDVDNNKTNKLTKNYFTALKALNSDDKPGFLTEITSIRQLVIEAFKQISLESTKNIYDYLTVLQSINEIEEIANACSFENQIVLINKWQNEDLQNLHDFKYIEQIQVKRIIISSIFLKKGNESLKPGILNLHLALAKMTRERGLTKQTASIIQKLRTLPNLNEEDLTRIHFEEIQSYWLTNKEIGSTLMQRFVEDYGDYSTLHSIGLKLYGIWMSEMGALDTQIIMKEYFQRSIQVLTKKEETRETVDMIIDAYDVLARFADEEYQRIDAYRKSSNFENKKKVMEKLKAAAKGFKNIEKTKSERTACVIFDKQSEIDEMEFRETQEQMNYFLQLSMKCYIHNLVRSDKYNIHIFRVVSMWLQNKTNSTLTEKTKDWLSTVPSYKYLYILPQLIPHIDSVDDFKTEILSILERCAVAHPHHTLPLILSMCNANKDDEYGDEQEKRKPKKSSSRQSCNSKTSSSSSSATSFDPRVDAALMLLNKLKKQPKLTELITKMITLSDALIDLAYIPSNREGKPTKVSLPYQSPIRKLKDFNEVALPTITIPFNINKEYNNIIGIHSFENDYYTVGGINQPKKIAIRGTDGTIRHTLIKGKDDMRQDAVMQQVFNIMNGLFRNNKETSKLIVRTYKVVPLSKRSGILEWVENAKALSMYLTETHERYSSVSLSSCRSKFTKVATRPSLAEKLRIFNEICQQLTPVFHRFFVNTFLESAIWYERRRAYITSVAVSSMCGYVLGVGDRHVTNILIDEKTAEVIHIDFGIAFEQGRVLPTPETVPFRLTREIVDGMGLKGTEGIFKRSCEKTLTVLRNNMETIIAILEVLLYDPLYVWTITPQQAFTKQLQKGIDEALPLIVFGEDENPVNVTAERVLLRIRDKLKGENDRTLEGQVLKLINQARDPANLCRLFNGWQPYL